MKAIPLLLRRVGSEIDSSCHIDCVTLYRVSKDKLLRANELERTIEAAARSEKPVHGLFILIDADKGCPATLGPQLVQRARKTRTDIPKGIVLAKCEYETWFIADFQNLANIYHKTAQPVPTPANPEAIRGAKEWLKKHLGFNYRETLHQEKLIKQFNISTARSTPSFDKCYREIEQLIDAALINLQ